MSEHADKEAPYIVAGYVGIPGQAIERWVGAMKLCGYVLVRAEREQALIDWLDAYFISGNEVPVERAAIRAEVWGKVKVFLREGRPLVHHVIEQEIAAEKWALRRAQSDPDAAAGSETTRVAEHRDPT